MKRIVAIVSAILLLIGLFVAILPVARAEEETILLAGSDFQVSAHNTSRIEQVLGTLEMHGITKADGAFFCGDYTLNPDYDNQGQSSAGLAVLKKLFLPIVGNKMTFVQGNHDPEDTIGLSKSGNNDPASGKYGVYVIHEDEYLQYDWNYSREVVEQTAANLKQYLDEKANSGWTKPIFILSHVGLHWGNRTIKEGSAIYGDMLVDVLNEGGKKGLNIIFLYGHDHSGGIADFMGGAAIYLKKGDTMEVCTGQKKEHVTRTLKFTYMNAGYIGYYSTDEPTCDDAVTMSVFRIRGDEVIITRYDNNINILKEQYGIHNLKSAGVWHPNYSKKGENAEPDTRVYTSSRKVTATDDVHVETPMPNFATTTTVSSKPYFTSTKNTGAAVNKTNNTTTTTQTVTTDTTAQQQTTTTVGTTQSTTGATREDAATTATTTATTTTAMVTEQTDTTTTAETTTVIATTTNAVSELVQTDAEPAPIEPGSISTETDAQATTPWILSPVGIALLITGGVLIVAIPIGVVAFFVLRKKKED